MEESPLLLEDLTLHISHISPRALLPRTIRLATKLHTIHRRISKQLSTHLISHSLELHTTNQTTLSLHVFHTRASQSLHLHVNLLGDMIPIVRHHQLGQKCITLDGQPSQDLVIQKNRFQPCHQLHNSHKFQGNREFLQPKLATHLHHHRCNTRNTRIYVR